MKQFFTSYFSCNIRFRASVLSILENKIKNQRCNQTLRQLWKKLMVLHSLSLLYIPLNKMQQIFFILIFLFSEHPEQSNTTSPANPNTTLKEGNITTRTCCLPNQHFLVLIGILMSNFLVYSEPALTFSLVWVTVAWTTWANLCSITAFVGSPLFLP